MLELMDEISELVYISDINTYELYYINEAGKKTFLNGEDFVPHRKCYEVLQGRTSPCPYCTNPMLTKDKDYTWQFSNPLTGRHYFLKDRLIDWNGRTARLEVAFDITESEIEKIKLKNALDAEKMILECIRTLYQNKDLNTALDDLLGVLGEALSADRTYIFRINNGRLSNTHEWCADNVEPQIQHLQDMDVALIDRWRPAFEKEECVVIEDTDDIREQSPEEYEVLAEQSIQSLVAAPLIRDGILRGCIGIDNPPADKLRNISPLLHTLCYFLITTVIRREDEKKLKKLSFYDSLTGLFNRNRYMTDIGKLEKQSCSVGVLFADVNGLKDINDHYGHSRGDEVLTECAAFMSSIFTGADCYRIGGDEFVVLQKHIEKEEFIRLSEKLRGKYQTASSCQVAVGCCWSDSSANIRTLLHEVDSQMYQDKKKYYSIQGASPRFGCREDKDGTLFHEYNMLMSTMRVSVSKHLMNEDFYTVWANDYYYEMTGYTREEYNSIFHKSCKEYFKNEPDEMNKLNKSIKNAIQKNRSNYEAILRMPQKGGSYIWIRVMGTFTEEKLDGIPVIYVTYTNISNLVHAQQELSAQRKLLEETSEKLRKLAFVDPITGGRSRTSFELDVERDVHAAPPFSYALVSMDIQKFKVINDLFGIQSGNDTLKYVQDTISDMLDSGEYIARIAADTFNLLLKYKNNNEIEERLNFMAEQINRFNGNMDYKYWLNLSVGIYPIDDPTLSITQLQDRATVARKQRKSLLGTKLCICTFYKTEDQLKMTREKEIENRMQDSLENGEFIVYLQPKQELKSHRIAGAEALVRWMHPEEGMIPPNHFIPLFERSGFIIDLDLYVFEQVCKILRGWIDSGLEPIPVSVNMSRAHLSYSDFLDRYESIRKKYEIPSSLLEIELTETLVFENPQLLSEVIDKIRSCGYSCSMDDFGSGYSSLNVLKNIRVDTLKLDRAFFSQTDTVTKREEDIISVVVELARRLNMKTVAEGVETDCQASFLKRTGCDMIQGYLFSRPVPVEDFEKLAFDEK